MNKRERVWNAEESGCQLNNRLTNKKVREAKPRTQKLLRTWWTCYCHDLLKCWCELHSNSGHVQREGVSFRIWRIFFKLLVSHSGWCWVGKREMPSWSGYVSFRHIQLQDHDSWQLDGHSSLRSMQALKFFAAKTRLPWYVFHALPLTRTSPSWWVLIQARRIILW
jgi:hypothetical protein